VSTYKKSAKAYAKNGFSPIPVVGKYPPIPGATGNEGTVTPEKIKGWRTTNANDNVALRADGFIGIDVDVYGDKHGDQTLASWQERLGELPKTWSSTARGKKSPSRQYFYRIPEGMKLATKLGSDIEIIQRHHRYAMVSPSVHPETGTEYTWYLPNGKKADRLPHIDELPDLPEAWLKELTAAPDATLLDVDVVPWRTLLDDFIAGPECYVAGQYAARIRDIDAAGHIGHDDALRLAHEGFMLGRENHHGIAEAIRDLEARHERYLNEARPRNAKHELDSLMQSTSSTAQRKLVEKQCTCFDRMSIVHLTDEEIKKEAALAPLIKPNGALIVDEARERFLAEHPVRRYEESVGASYVWLGDRWRVTDLREVCYRWLAVRLGPEMTSKKADELYRAAITFAEVIDDDDIDDRYISVANGLLDWQTGELRPRTPDLFVINHLPIKWVPGATPGKFNEWMATAVEPEMIPHVWEIIGYTVSPVHDLKVALAFSGMGGGGKSTLMNVLSNLVGKTNTSNLAPQAVGERFNRALLHGKLLNDAADVGAETIRNNGILKSIIARDSISAEKKGRDGFNFRPNVFIVAAFNALPATESNDSGFWDRWLVLSFKKRFIDEAKGMKEDTTWRDKMPYDPDVLEGVLVEAVTALRRLRDRGTFDKKAFLPAKTEWRQEVDGVAAFAEERLVIDEGGLVKAKTLHDVYAAYELGNGGKSPRKNQTFYRELHAYLEERHPGKVHRERLGANVLTFVGVKIVHSPDDSKWQILDPDQAYGPQGWTAPVPHLRAV
jgi:P4 family phage/plasmid primase-like protien